MNSLPPHSEQIIAFLRAIGLRVRFAPITGPTFLPGIEVQRGELIVDPAQLLYPGDLLHEAGHLAVVSPARRARMDGNIGQKAHEELMAIAWSYAAVVHLDLDPAVVFHADGYRGWSQALIENFTAGRYLGVPTLQWLGLTAEVRRAAELGIAPYPHMLKWLLD
jgi:hypothetical protein